MRFSKFSHIYESIYENQVFYIIRHSVTNKSFFVNEEEFNLLIKQLQTKESSETITLLRKEHILVPDNYSEEKFVSYLKEKYNLNKFKLEIIYLIFNTSCNLKCKYCYVEGSKESAFLHNSMNKKTFHSLMNYLAKLIKSVKDEDSNKNKLTFIYYGSEPLISKDLFVQSLRQISIICKINKIIPDFQLITNATLFDKKILNLIKKFNVKISISLDGEKSVNDSMRIDSKGRGTYDKIVQNIKQLNKLKIPFGISCTINAHNLNCLKKNINHFYMLGAKSIGFNILLNARHNKIPLVPLTKLNNSLLEASFKAEKLGIYEDRIQRKIEAFNNLPRFKDCGGVGNQLVFFPNGDICPCEGYLCNRKYILGDINNTPFDELKKSPILKKWSERYPLNMKECIYCPALGICGGGCPFNAETFSKGNIYARDKSFCVHTELALNWLLARAIEEKTKKKNPYIREITFMYSQDAF